MIFRMNRSFYTRRIDHAGYETGEGVCWGGSRAPDSGISGEAWRNGVAPLTGDISP